jgi:PAS domain S-box-containing protein
MNGIRRPQSDSFFNFGEITPSAGKLFNSLGDSTMGRVDRDGFHGARSTERDELWRLREWLSLAMQSAELGLWQWDIPTGLFQVSSHWRELLGLVVKERIPRTIDDWLALVHADDRTACDRFVASLRSRPGVTRQVEFRLQRVDGSFSWQLCKGCLMPEAGGVPRLAVGVMIDVTAQREATARQHQIERLEAVGQLTGGLAHDFNNLLTVIQGNIELLSDDLGDDPACAAMLAEIGTVVDRGSAVTRRLLRFARSDISAKETTDPDALLLGLLPLLDHTLGGAVALRTDLAARGWSVDIDAREFENAIINLAINGRDAMQTGGELTLSTRPVWLRAHDIHPDRGELPGAYVMVEVSDNGHGMTPDVLSRIFEPFFTTKADKGTGLGVPMVARFVRHSDGCMRVESDVGTGTKVRLYLPRSIAAA